MTTGRNHNAFPREAKIRKRSIRMEEITKRDFLSSYSFNLSGISSFPFEKLR